MGLQQLHILVLQHVARGHMGLRCTRQLALAMSMPSLLGPLASWLTDRLSELLQESIPAAAINQLPPQLAHACRPRWEGRQGLHTCGISSALQTCTCRIVQLTHELICCIQQYCLTGCNAECSFVSTLSLAALSFALHRLTARLLGLLQELHLLTL